MSNHIPKVSIGMPAYNAERTLGMAVESLLAQSFADFELIVSDNASSDGTWDLLQDYARRDPRVMVRRQARNIGANANYSAVVRDARGRYFKWASSNDWCSSDMLAKCVEYLDVHPDVVLVAPRTRLFQGSPEMCFDYEGDLAFDNDNPLERFRQITSRLALNNIINGLIRRDALQRTRLIDHYPSADMVLVAHLALIGKIALLNEHLYYRQMARETATPMMSAEAVRRHHYPEHTLRSLFPSWRLAAGWTTAVLSAGLKVPQALSALDWALRLAYWRKNALWRDIVEATRYAALRALGTGAPGQG